MIRFGFAIFGIALTALAGSVVTALNGAEAEANFSWPREVLYLLIAAVFLLALGWWAYGARRIGVAGWRTALALVTSIAASGAAVLLFNRGLDLRDAWARSVGPRRASQPGGAEELSAIALVVASPLVACAVAGHFSRPLFTRASAVASFTWLLGVALTYGSRDL